MRAFKSKTPPLLVDTTVLFPPKKAKGEGRRRFLFVFFFPCLSIPRSPFTLLFSLSPCLPSVSLALVCSTNVERTREALNPPDTPNWLFPSIQKTSNVFLKTSFKSSFNFSLLHFMTLLIQSISSLLFSPFLLNSNQMLTLINKFHCLDPIIVCDNSNKIFFICR